MDPVNKECLDLIVNMIAIKPEKRIKIEDIAKHPWVKD